jgi:hypothetical protein
MRKTVSPPADERSLNRGTSAAIAVDTFSVPRYFIVIAGLDPAIHVFAAKK